MKIGISQSALQPYREIEQYQQQALRAGSYGATASFVGTMRDFNEDRKVQAMTLEYYPGMTELHIIRICEQATVKWSLLDSLLIHRVGEIHINDPIVVIAVWAAHRGDALDACRFIIEDLKANAPFWKKERTENGEVWVQGNSAGYQK